jgi:hypothetical protein
MFSSKHLARVNVVFSGHPEREDFANRGLLPDNVKALIEALESIHNDLSNLSDNNPYKYFVSHNERPRDEDVKEMLLLFLLSNDAVQEAMLAYFNATSEWDAYLRAPYNPYALLTEVTKWENGSDALQKKVNDTHTALDKVVADALLTPLIQDFLSTVRKIVDDADKARHASLSLYGDVLEMTMAQHMTTRNDLVQMLTIQLRAIEEEVIAENPEQP